MFTAKYRLELVEYINVVITFKITEISSLKDKQITLDLSRKAKKILRINIENLKHFPST